MTPQSVHQLGGYRIQGNTDSAEKQLIEDAQILEQSGATFLLMEMIPATLAKQMTDILTIPSIGIGAGRACSAQVLVLHDMLGLYQGKKAKFVKNFMANAGSIQEAVSDYVNAVKTNQFPASEHEFQ